LGGRIPEKIGMNELARRACESNRTGYCLQTSRDCREKHFSLSSNYWQLWKKTSALSAILDN
jgi:hypothetical protein